MLCSIGKQLGTLLAQCEEDLYCSGGDIETLQKVALISETYRNFIQAGSQDFNSQFQIAYDEELIELSKTRNSRPDRGALLSAYDKMQHLNLD